MLEALQSSREMAHQVLLRHDERMKTKPCAVYASLLSRQVRRRLRCADRSQKRRVTASGAGIYTRALIHSCTYKHTSVYSKGGGRGVVAKQEIDVTGRPTPRRRVGLEIPPAGYTDLWRMLLYMSSLRSEQARVGVRTQTDEFLFGRGKIPLYRESLELQQAPSLCSVGDLLSQLLGLSTNIAQVTNHVEGGLGEIIELSSEDGL